MQVSRPVGCRFRLGYDRACGWGPLPMTADHTRYQTRFRPDPNTAKILPFTKHGLTSESRNFLLPDI
jgi:hypothetical protein